MVVITRLQATSVMDSWAMLGELKKKIPSLLDYAEENHSILFKKESNYLSFSVDIKRIYDYLDELCEYCLVCMIEGGYNIHNCNKNIKFQLWCVNEKFISFINMVDSVV